MDLLQVTVRTVWTAVAISSLVAIATAVTDGSIWLGGAALISLLYSLYEVYELL